MVIKRLLIVIPTYNEVGNIQPLFSAIETALGKRGYHFAVLFVDDTSPDGTAREIKRLQKSHPNIFLLSGPKTGLGKAYIRGLEYAKAQGSYDALVMMDADLSHDPADISLLLSGLENGADYVVGSRYVSGGSSAYSRALYRGVVSRVANAVARQSVGNTVKVRDLTSGFKVMRMSALHKVPFSSLSASGYVFQVALLEVFVQEGFVVEEMPITFKRRQYGQSKLRPKDIWEFLGLLIS